MHLFSLIGIICFTLALSEGLIVLLFQSERKENRLFFMMTFCLAIWCLGAAMGHSETALQAVRFWFRFASFGFIFLHTFTLHFTIRLTGIKFPTAGLIAVYLPSLVFYPLSLTTIFVYRDFVLKDFGWVGIPNLSSPLFLSFLGSYLIEYFVALILIFRWGQKSVSKKDKKVAVAIFISLFFMVLLFNAEPFLLPLFSGYDSLMISPFFGIIWTSVTGFSIYKWRFMRNESSFLAKRISYAIHDPMIFTDGLGRIRGWNSAADQNKWSGLKVDNQIEEVFSFSEKRFERGMQNKFPVHLTLEGPSNTGQYHLEINPIQDDEGETAGYLYRVRLEQDRTDVSEKWNLSPREIEVLNCIMSGNTNAEIAKTLQITERTVKAHLHNIFEKSSYFSKNRLMAVLHDNKKI